VAIAHTNTVSRTANITTPIVVDRASTTDNRILIVGIAVANATVTVTPPAGFTPINEISFTGGKLFTYWHLTASDPITWNFTTDLGANTRVCSMATEFSGVDTVSPVDVASEQANASSASVVAPGVDPGYLEDMLVFYGAVANLSSWTAPSSPGAFTEPANGDRPAAAGAISLGTSYLLLASGAATGDVTATASIAGANAGQLIALKDAAGTPDGGSPADHPLAGTFTAPEGGVAALGNTPRAATHAVGARKFRRTYSRSNRRAGTPNT
jgi:hypothetical protein